MTYDDDTGASGVVPVRMYNILLHGCLPRRRPFVELIFWFFVFPAILAAQPVLNCMLLCCGSKTITKNVLYISRVVPVLFVQSIWRHYKILTKPC